jgi:hypothetical protein
MNAVERGHGSKDAWGGLPWVIRRRLATASPAIVPGFVVHRIGRAGALVATSLPMSDQCSIHGVL